MDATERKMLSLLSDAGQKLAVTVDSMAQVVASLHTRLEALEGVLKNMEGPLTGAITAGGVSILGMLLAELASGEQAKFDQLMARTTAFAEATAGGWNEPARGLLLESMDTIVGVADGHFARTRRK